MISGSSPPHPNAKPARASRRSTAEPSYSSALIGRRQLLGLSWRPVALAGCADFRAHYPGPDILFVATPEQVGVEMLRLASVGPQGHRLRSGQRRWTPGDRRRARVRRARRRRGDRRAARADEPRVGADRRRRRPGDVPLAGHLRHRPSLGHGGRDLSPRRRQPQAPTQAPERAGARQPPRVARLRHGRLDRRSGAARARAPRASTRSTSG